MKLPVQKKILREDLKDAPEWSNEIVGPLNQFMEVVYQALNKNIDEVNLSSMVKDVVVVAPSTYPVMDVVKFQTNLKVKATGCTILQCINRSTFTPVATGNPAWIDNNGTIEVSGITGLTANQSYTIRFRVT